MPASSELIPRHVHVEHCMGTVFSIDIRDPGEWSDATGAVIRWLYDVDAIFSTYRDDSDISRIQRGELGVDAAHPHVSEVLARCADLHRATNGYFSARWQGKIDPTGLVKGWAVDRASALLRSFGSENHAINGGGDIQLAGEAAPGSPWRVGIADPNTPGKVLTTLSGRDFAVATSGIAERGPHIYNPFTGIPAHGLSSMTVTGPSITEADAYATAAFVMADHALGWVAELPGYNGIAGHEDGSWSAKT